MHALAASNGGPPVLIPALRNSGSCAPCRPFCRKKGNAWLSPKGEGQATWEEVPYWFRVFIALGYVLEDQRIIEASKPWIENLFATHKEGGYFGPPKNRGDAQHGPDLMPSVTTTIWKRKGYSRIRSFSTPAIRACF